jgi:hypothetical protein
MSLPNMTPFALPHYAGFIRTAIVERGMLQSVQSRGEPEAQSKGETGSPLLCASGSPDYFSFSGSS